MSRFLLLLILLALLVTAGFVGYNYLFAPSESAPEQQASNSKIEYAKILADLQKQYTAMYQGDGYGEQDFRLELLALLLQRQRQGLDNGTPAMPDRENLTIEGLAHVPVIHSLLHRLSDSPALMTKTSYSAFLRPLAGDHNIDWQASNRFTSIYDHAFANNQQDGLFNALHMRRLLQDRLTDLRQTARLSSKLAVINPNPTTHPVLNWLIRSLGPNADRLQEVDRQYQEFPLGHMEFISPNDCIVAEILEKCWPEAMLFHVENDSINVAANIVSHRRSPRELIKKIENERTQVIPGLTPTQQQLTDDVYNRLEQFLQNELNRPQRVRADDWRRQTVN